MAPGGAGQATLASFDAIATESALDLSAQMGRHALRRRRLTVTRPELDGLEAEIRARAEPAFGSVWPGALHTTISPQRHPADYQAG